MDDEGKITVEPADNVECFALKSWTDKNKSGDIEIKTEIPQNTMGFKKE